MGDLNLGIDIAKLKKSAGGGGGGGGGVTIDKLWTGNLTDSYVDITDTMTAPLSDYVAICVSQNVSNTCGVSGFMPVIAMETGANNINSCNIGNVQVRIRLGEGTVSVSSTTSQSAISIYGIK